MRTFDVKIGSHPATVVAPQPGHFLGGLFNACFPPGALYGLDCESSYMGDLGQWAPDFRLRLIQFATPECAWVLNLDDPAQKAAAVELLEDPTVQFCSHTNMDVLSVRAVLGVDIADRNLDTRMLAQMAAPDDRKGTLDLKTLTTTHLGPELKEADDLLYAHFVELWVAQGGRKGAAKSEIERHGWSAVDPDNELYLVYAGLDAIACRRLVEVQAPMTGAPVPLLKMECWLAAQANKIQARGMRVDPKALDELHGEAFRETTAAETTIAEITGLKARSPKLHDWLGEHGVDWDSWEGARTDTGTPSLAKQNVKLLESYPLDEDGQVVVRELIRLKAHLDALNKTNGIRSHLGADGRLHPALNTLGAVTGRMSSSGPNFQNFSKSDARTRGLFIPEPGHVLVTADFDQIELRVVAALAREDKMIDTILADGDLHQLTADEIGIDRSTAKMVNFLIVYGGGGNALHEQANIPLDDAKRIVYTFRDRYPAINALSRQLSQHRDAVRTISNRRIPVTANKRGDLRTFANINYVVQSSARELLVDAWYRFATEFGRADLVWFPVHDELILQVPEGQVDQVVDEVQRCMRFDFMGVPISASAVVLLDEDGTSRWMTSKRAEQIAAQRATTMAA